MKNKIYYGLAILLTGNAVLSYSWIPGFLIMSVDWFMIWLGLENIEEIETKVDLLFDQHWIEDENGFHRRDVFEGEEHKKER